MNIHDARMRMIEHLREALADESPEFYAVVSNDSGTSGIGHANTTGMGNMLERLCLDAIEAHTFGHCADCDRVALAVQASLDAYLSARGEPTGCRETKQ